MKYDQIDKKIINALLEDSRRSFREIAKVVGVSAVTVLKRVKALQDNKILKGFSASVDYVELGYDFPVVIRISIAQGKLFEVEKKIARHPNVFAMYDITGDYDALVVARFKSRRALDLFLKKIQGLEYVEKTGTNLILNRIKEENIRVE